MTAYFDSIAYQKKYAQFLANFILRKLVEFHFASNWHIFRQKVPTGNSIFHQWLVTILKTNTIFVQ